MPSAWQVSSWCAPTAEAFSHNGVPHFSFATADLLEGAGAALLAETGRALRGLEDLAALLDRAVAEEPPATTGEGGMIRRGWSEELDRVVELSENGKGVIASLESRERQRTGIGSLKVRYNRVFGYYIEVTKSNLHAVPADYHRKQTIAGGERYITPALKEQEEKLLHAEERIAALENEIAEKARAISASLDPSAVPIARATVTPKKGQVELVALGLGWLPYRASANGAWMPAWPR